MILPPHSKLQQGSSHPVPQLQSSDGRHHFRRVFRRPAFTLGSRAIVFCTWITNSIDCLRRILERSCNTAAWPRKTWHSSLAVCALMNVDFTVYLSAWLSPAGKRVGSAINSAY